jgi:xanthine dehydrogenase YagS FAD-binding subunit
MVHPSDMAPPLITLGARVKIVGPKGSKILPIEKFFIKPGQDILKENVLKPDEILMEIHIPDAPPNTEGYYLKSRIRRAWDFALTGAAVVITSNDGICKDCKIALSGVAPIPLRAPKAEETLRGKKIDESLALQAAHTALMGARALSMNAYKVDMAKALTKRAILSG